MFRRRLIGGVAMGVVGVLSMTMPLWAAATDAPLADAAMANDIEAVRSLLIEDEVDVNAAQGDGMTALHWAAFQDDVEMAKLLIAAEANVKAKIRIGGTTPLALASKNGSAEMIETLVDAGADVHALTSNGTTHLMSAALSGSAAAVSALLDHGAFVNARESTNGQTALMFAAWENRPEVIRVLAERGGHVGLASLLVPMTGPPVDTVGNVIVQPPQPPQPPAPAAGQAGARGGGPGGQPQAPPQNRRPGRPRAPGTNSIMGGMTALLFAARDGNLESVRALVEAGADVDQVNVGEGSSAMVIAIANGHYTVAKFLLDSGADPNLANLDGLTPLYATVNMRYAPVSWAPNPRTDQETVDSLDLLQAFLDRGADPDARIERKLWFSPTSHNRGWIDPAGSTAFWRAAQSSDVEAMRVLVEGGADPRLTSKGGATPLVVASGIGWIGNFTQNSPDSWMDAVRYCVELGNDVNAPDVDGFTALHGAAARGDEEMILYLLDEGADIEAINKDGNSVADMAFGPSRFFIPKPLIRDLLVKLGSPFQDNCRSDQCVDGKFNAEGRSPN